MDNFISASLGRFFAWYNLIIIVFLLAESYILPPIRTKETFDRFSSSTTRTGIGRSYLTEELLTYEGGVYQLPDYTAIRIVRNDTIFVSKSFCSKSILDLTYRAGNNAYIVDMGLVNSHNEMFILFCIALVILVAYLTGHSWIRNRSESIHIILMIGALIMTVLVIAFIFKY